MHIVTRTQLGSTEDDNQRLRLQLSNLRKRYTHTASEDRLVSQEGVWTWSAEGQQIGRVMLKINRSGGVLTGFRPAAMGSRLGAANGWQAEEVRRQNCSKTTKRLVKYWAYLFFPKPWLSTQILGKIHPLSIDGFFLSLHFMQFVLACI